jgi:superfamily II DNA/RNA helicase
MILSNILKLIKLNPILKYINCYFFTIRLDKIFPAFIHGDLSQSERIKAINKLYLEKTKIIVSTDLVLFI